MSAIRLDELVALRERGQGAAGLERGERLLALQPAEADALHFVGILHCESGSVERGRGLLAHAVRLEPGNPQLWLNLARAEERAGVGAAALATVQYSLVLSPGEVASWSLRGRLSLLEPRTADDAARFFHRVLILRSPSDDGFYQHAVALKRADDPTAASVSYRHAVALNPARFDVFVGYAEALVSLTQFIEAILWYRRASAVDPANHDIAYWQSLTELRLGRFEEGWFHYESRWESSVSVAHRATAHAYFEGRPRFSPDVAGQRVLLWAEQGVGDEIMFGGLLREFRAKSRCAELLVTVDPRLLTLFRRSFADIKFFAHDEPVPLELYDEQLPLGSLGFYCRPSRASFDAGGERYLHLPSGIAEQRRAELGIGSREFLVGLSWRSANPETGRSRSVSLQCLIEALGFEGVRFVNLQYGNMTAEITSVAVRTGKQVVSHPDVDTRNDLESVAAMIEACNLVISVGNATAHLAGALGQKTWVLLPHVAGWRWLHEGSSCPWYRSVRLFRQSVRDDWADVMNDIRGALIAEINL